MNKLHLIATGDGNWDYYIAPPFKDGSQAVMYIAKEGSGAGSGIYCGVSRLKAHFRHLQNIKHGSAWDSMIPDDWHIIDNEFFSNLGIA